MKLSCTLAAVVMLGLGVTTGTARAADGPETTLGTMTITDFVARSGGDFDRNRFDYDILLNAVLAADLAEALGDPNADLTLWAPNDLGFVNLARDLGYEGYDEEGTWLFLVDVLTELGNGDPIPVLTDILLYHVAGERINAIEVFIRSFFRIPIDTLQGASFQPFFFRMIDNEPDLRDPYLFFPLNVHASNGIIHTVNRVLIPVDLP